MKKILPVVLIGLLLVGCYQDNEEELYGKIVCVDPPTITFSSTINGILQSYTCITCHNANTQSGGVNLVGYDNVKISVFNKSLMGAITHQAPFKPMPENLPPMSICDINKVRAWINVGAPNN
jgi:hypothetical protein